LALEGLSERDVAEYIEVAAGIAPPPELVKAISSETEGSPLFVTEIVRLLAAEGRLSEPGVHLGLPPGVRAVIGRRVMRLSVRCRSALMLAAVLGREFALEPLARLAELSRVDLLRVLDEAVAERVVGAVPKSPDRRRFAHALIRDALYDELTPSQRLELHRRAGGAPEGAYAGELELH